MKNHLRNALTGVALFLAAGCASISSPEGGDRDITAPTLIASTPKNGLTNTKPEKIILTFDEAIQAPDLTRELLIAPLTNNTYKTKIKNETIEITFTEPWLENTTYNLNFRKGITDVTEKNAAKNLVITFATGNYLDSGRVSGTVAYLFSNTTPKETSVLLYRANDTTQIAKGKPLYVTSSDSAGNFTFTNIKEGNYHLYALLETNNTLKYDSEKEAIAYLADSIQVRPAAKDLKLILHTQDTTKPNVISRKGFTNAYEVTYNEGLAKATVKGAEKSEDIKWLLDPNGKTLRLFPAKPEEKKWLVEVQDSAQNVKVDTIAVRLSGSRAPRKANSFTVANGTTIQPGQEIKLSFEVPTKIVQPLGAVTLVYDSVKTVSSKDAKDLVLNQTGTEITVKLPMEAKSQVTVTLDTTKIVPFIGDRYATNTQKLTVSDKITTGSLQVKLATKEKNFFVQLLRQDQIVKEVKNKTSILWTDLEPGTYQLRILIDANGNGKWDNGLLKARRLPEPVVLPKEIFEIRSNWEIETSTIQF
ncbi:Ig-like domain-containing protein [Rufibacter soli]